ncbi:uncharacterized protein ACA1_055960 [Acanthamoeba castellanii str. Neff]|uniref:Uncharacterized protein n=1 Tax=Acanthamoeba castellanii (strain ATCC 30010 / Neff) TaxID=1257118 RepID=L8H6M8_ACACF|nr:uncharacterized protein ACA1_055960 [Acanthamoeba castellanii str. Neff]ELR20810.1 hypothetical protein ACA1_055960 [Acanthamoeba castellanii str. Neff]
MQDHHHHAYHQHADHHHHQQQHAYSPAPQQHYAYPPVVGPPYGGAVNEVHVYHHAAPSFPEYVPDELRGRVADGDYVAHIRQLNSDLSRASWGPCCHVV